MHFVLSSRGLSLADVARQSQARFAANPLFRIPPNFYDALRRPSFSPSIHQLYALSLLTSYRLSDWASLFGLSFDDAARFQASRPRHYTAELDTRVYDPTAEVPWFDQDQPPTLGAELMPLSRWLTGKAVRPLNSLSDVLTASLRYLKIGSRDVYAFPDLLPGSIVRIRTDIPPSRLLTPDAPSGILAIQSRRGIFCSRVRSLPPSRIVLCSRHLPYPPIELELGVEARILGYIDLELRRLRSPEMPDVPSSWRSLASSRTVSARSKNRVIGEFLRGARLRSGLSLREASQRTAEIARSLGDTSYFCAPGTLSDLEVRDRLPRHVQKWISLSAAYCVPLAELAGRAGLPLEENGRDPMPRPGSPSTPAPHQPSPFLEAARQVCGELPFYLYKALSDLIGLHHLSVRDLFWAGATADLVHPYLRQSFFLAIDRKRKSPSPSFSSPVWAQPLYVLELRDGRRMSAACGLEGDTLVVRPCTTASGGVLRLRHLIDVEVLGTIVGVVRRL
jgi:hypothetical protein